MMVDLAQKPYVAPAGWMVPARPFVGDWTGEPISAEPRHIAGSTKAPELCQLAGVWREELHPENALADPKLNGIRALYLGCGSDAHLVTREGAPLVAATPCLSALWQLEQAFGKPMMFDVEYVVDGDTAAPGPSNAANRRNRPTTAGALYVFDAVPMAQWQDNRATAPLAARRGMLLDAFMGVTEPGLGLVTGSYGVQAKEATGLARFFWSRGYEGLVIKDANGMYRRGRSSRDWLKLKETN